MIFFKVLQIKDSKVSIINMRCILIIWHSSTKSRLENKKYNYHHRTKHNFIHRNKNISRLLFQRKEKYFKMIQDKVLQGDFLIEKPSFLYRFCKLKIEKCGGADYNHYALRCNLPLQRVRNTCSNIPLNTQIHAVNYLCQSI